MSFLAEAEALELELRARLLGRRVVLEIGLNADLHERVTRALDPIVRGRDAARVTHQFPALVATYLVGHAVYHYRGGGLWGSIDIRGVDQSWGERFTVAVERLGLESFEDLVINENAQRYVSRIVAHGGVPRSCVADLFRLVFHDLPHCADAREMLARWRSRASTFSGVDRPVERFFTYGGPIAVDFLNRCIDLVRHEAQLGALPSPDDVGLPPYVLTAYRDIEGRLDQARRSARRSGPGLPSPVVSLDPWSGTGPVLMLPAVGDRGSGHWEVIGEELHRFPTSRFDTRQVPLDPATRWQVQLRLGDRVDDWVFDASEFGPLLLFDPVTGNRIDPAAGIRSDDVWVLSFRDVALAAVLANGEASQPDEVEELPHPVGGWSSWTLRHLELARATALGVRHATLERRISVRSGAARPMLVPEPP